MPLALNHSNVLILVRLFEKPTPALPRHLENLEMIIAGHMR